MTETTKKYITIGCCGIDCGLCPRFHTKGDSVCPGCGGLHFREKHPSCGYLTCCVIKKGYEVCSDCNDYPCSRFDSEKKGFDSFVTHRKVFDNLDYIKKYGHDSFIEQQKERVNILVHFLAKYDDGRSKSFICISCTLLPLDRLQQARKFIDNLDSSSDNKEKNKQLRNRLEMIAQDLKFNLKLNHNK